MSRTLVFFVYCNFVCCFCGVVKNNIMRSFQVRPCSVPLFFRSGFLCQCAKSIALISHITVRCLIAYIKYVRVNSEWPRLVQSIPQSPSMKNDRRDAVNWAKVTVGHFPGTLTLSIVLTLDLSLCSDLYMGRPFLSIYP